MGLVQARGLEADWRRVREKRLEPEKCREIPLEQREKGWERGRLRVQAGGWGGA